MTLWGCTNCGAVMVDADNLMIGEKEFEKEEGEVEVEYYVEHGFCPGCGGRGVPVEQVDLSEQNN